MRIVINHLTRMQPGYICVAGLDPHTLQHIRPVTRGRLNRSQLRTEGGAFDLGALVDIGEAPDVGVAPEVEDRAFNPWMATYLRDYEAFAFWALLRESARPRLAEIFGPELRQVGVTCALDVGTGRASLGCLLPTGRPSLHLSDQGSVRMWLSDGALEVSVPVTDLRLYAPDHQTPRHAAVADLNARLSRGVPVVLSVGVSRGWQKPGETAPRHWLQVNSIHLGDRPLWTWQEIARAAGSPPPTQRHGLDDLPF